MSVTLNFAGNEARHDEDQIIYCSAQENET